MPLSIMAGMAAGHTVEKVAQGLMSTLLTATRNSMDISSLADLTKPLRVEPLAIIDQTLDGQPYMQDILKMALSSFSGYYLQAVNMVMGVGKIDTLKVFDTLNPMRSLGGNIASTVFSKEQYEEGLPAMESFSLPVRDGLVAEYSMDKFVASMEDDTQSAQSIGSSDNQRIYESENLAVGKLLNVEVKDGDVKAKLPVLVRLIPAVVPPQALTHIFTAGGRDSWAHRMFLVKTGQIKFWRDFVLGQDMIDAHFSALMSDKSGVYKNITDRRRNNVAKSVTSGRVSMADASNIAIVSASTIKQSANALYGRLDDMSVRQKIFDNSYLLMLIVVDERRDMVRIFHRGVDLSTTHRIDEIKMQEKSKGPDITEIYKLFSKTMQTNV